MRIYDTELGIMLPSATVKVEMMTVHPLFVLIRENFIITVHNEAINRLLRFSRTHPSFSSGLPRKAHPIK